MAQEWNIKPRGTGCTACSTAFVEGQHYFTRLTFQAGDYTRGDYCEQCRDAANAAQPGYSSWKGVFHAPPVTADYRVRRETAESLLRTLIDEDDPSKRQVIYILAVMLERQRSFVERDVRTMDDGSRVVVYEHRKTGETFAILDPQLKLTEIEPLQQEIMTLLRGQGADAVEAPAPVAPPGEGAAVAPEQAGPGTHV
jgi:hypothetical protein